MIGFSFHCRTRIEFGPGCVARAGEFASSLGGRRVMLVTDPGLVAAGHAQRVQDILIDHAESVTVFSDVHENPSTDDVARAVHACSQIKPDLLVALGGGSTIDTAKAANLVHCNGGAIADYVGDGKATHALLPLIAIPTTAGTGSEVQRFALVSDAATHRKLACGDVKATPAVAMLDPQLTHSCPRMVTIYAGIDALSHAMETAVTRTRHAMSLMCSHAAARRLVRSLPRVLDHPDDCGARADVLLGATWAGLAIEHSMLGAAHACANPLTARFGVVHGHAVGIMLPHVMRFNAADAALAEAYAAAGVGDVHRVVDDLLGKTGLALRLRDLGVTDADVPALAADAALQWTGRHNPRPLTPDDIADLYHAAL